MLAIDFIPLLVGLAHLASASPLTRPASADVSLATTAAESSSSSSTTTAVAAIVTTLQRPASSADKPARNHGGGEQRDAQASPQAQRRADFATSPASSTVAVAAPTSTVAAAEDSFNDDSAREAAAATTSKTQGSADAATTAAPTDNPFVDADLAKEGYSELTYYSCEKYATATLCGWHEPVIHVGKTGGAARHGGRGGGVGARPGLVAAGAAMCGAALNMMLAR